MAASLVQEQRGMFTMPLNQGSTPDLVGGLGRHENQANDPQVSAQMSKHQWYPTQGQCAVLIYYVGEMEGQQAPEAGRPA